MITLSKVGGQIVTSVSEFMCLSSDVPNLPTEGIPNGSNAFLMDTNEIAFFDAENGIWITAN